MYRNHKPATNPSGNSIEAFRMIRSSGEEKGSRAPVRRSSADHNCHNSHSATGTPSGGNGTHNNSLEPLFRSAAAAPFNVLRHCACGKEDPDPTTLPEALPRTRCATRHDNAHSKITGSCLCYGELCVAGPSWGCVKEVRARIREKMHMGVMGDE